jgi:hypothetical protein
MRDLIIICMVIGVPLVLVLLFFTQLSLKKVFLVMTALAALTAVAATLFSYQLARTMARRHGPPHVFNLSANPEFLVEQIAIEKAAEALALDGLGSDFQPIPDSRSSAPDGVPDQYLVRNTLNPNMGDLAFSNTVGARFFVTVELQDRKLTCRRIALK